MKRELARNVVTVMVAAACGAAVVQAWWPWLFVAFVVAGEGYIHWQERRLLRELRQHLNILEVAAEQAALHAGATLDRMIADAYATAGRLARPRVFRETFGIEELPPAKPGKILH